MDLNFCLTIWLASFLIFLNGQAKGQNQICLDQMKTAEQKCNKEASEWLPYGGTQKSCCLTRFLADCIKKEMKRECTQTAEEWLSPTRRAFLETACPEFTAIACKDLLNTCNAKTSEYIQNCRDEIKREYPEEDNICCVSLSIERCLSSKSIPNCFDERQTLTNVWDFRDYKNRKSCDYTQCEESAWAAILIGLVIIIVFIFLLVSFYFLRNFMRKREERS
ncbi:uncharacterized protein LOC141856147 [Brevipalpus obovatus]|uniref:uncharacterized protein LOC141856147 n=1 Tax=Brevipalpus obovatus TaxID=246614 RepID=UPI003D9DC367